MTTLLDSAKARLVSQEAALKSTRESLKEARAKGWKLAIAYLVNVERRQAVAYERTKALVDEVSNAK